MPNRVSPKEVIAMFKLFLVAFRALVEPCTRRLSQLPSPRGPAVKYPVSSVTKLAEKWKPFEQLADSEALQRRHTVEPRSDQDSR